MKSATYLLTFLILLAGWSTACGNRASTIGTVPSDPSPALTSAVLTATAAPKLEPTATHRPNVGPLHQDVRVEGGALPPEVQRMPTFLPLPSGLSVIYYTDVDAFRGLCSGSAGCYESRQRQIKHLAPEVYSSVTLRKAPTFAWGMAHEMCHAYQHEQVLESGWANPNDIRHWLDMPQGLAFQAVADAIFNDLQARGIRSAGDRLEDFANVCALWFIDNRTARSIPTVREFGDEWLP